MLQIVHRLNAALLLLAPHLGAVLLLGRKAHVRVVQYALQIHALAERHLAGELRGSHLGHETVRQVSIYQMIIRDPSFSDPTHP